MYFFYVDESGTLDPRVEGIRADGSIVKKEYLYVLTAVSLYDHRWHGFDKSLNRKKWELVDITYRSGLTPSKLELADCEVKSTWVRIPKERAKRPFLTSLSDEDLTGLIDLFYAQLSHHYMRIFSVVVDKRYLHDYMDSAKLHRKAWELLLEQIERFMREEHDKHQGVLITDDLSRERNRSLAMKHAYFQSEGTSSNMWLTHIAEMPLFVRSELSNGVQLADLLAYNIYRCFRDENPEYPHFARMISHLWTSKRSSVGGLDGMRIFPPQCPLGEIAKAIAKKKGEQGRSPKS